jgi:predicted esterase
VAPPSHPFEGAELYVHLPPQTQARQPLRVFLVLHGMGNRGDTFSQNLIKIADANHWVLIAPTFHYRDYLDPQQLREDDIQLSGRLLDTLDVLPQRLNVKLYRQVLIYGYSRGAQLGHRFTYFHPERVKSIAVLAAGAYTMPTEKIASGKGTPTVVPFPYGVGDLQECVGKPLNWQALKRVSFWVGVGENDNHPQDVARAFDPYGGRTRVERAQSFKQALQSLGIRVQLDIFPNVSHEITSEMRARALQFLREEELADPLDD